MSKFFSVVSIGFLSVSLLAFSGCRAESRKVTRIDNQTTQDLSGRWNNNDARFVADQIGRNMQDWSARVSADFQLRQNRKPYLIVRKIRNRTMEHIDTRVFMQEIQRALLNTGNVAFVADAGERGQLDEERRYQDMNASEESRKEKGSEIGADYAIIGEMNAIDDSRVDRRRGVKEIVYQITIKVSDILTNEIVWTDNQTIAKRIERARSSW